MGRRLAIYGLILGAMFATALPGQEGQDANGVVFRVPVEGVIELGLAPFVERGIREAEARGASAVILDIDTPGGRVDAAERIADAVSDSEVPVYAYVNRRALSAGALISLATQRIYMRPGSIIGAATPVTGEGVTAPEKIVSAMRSSMRALAEARGLDPRIAEAMVDEQIAVEGVVEAGQLLTLTTSEAVEVEYARAVEHWEGLLEDLGLQGAAIEEMEVNWAERMVRFFSHPMVAPFLLTLGFLGLIAEVKTPGVGIAGAVGVVSLGLFFGSHIIIGLAGMEALLIFGLGVALLLIEAFLLPGMGVFGILGVLGVLGGIYMSLLGGLPTQTDFTRAGGVLAATLVLTIMSAWVLITRLPTNQRLIRMGIMLGEATGRETGYTSSVMRAELIGREGVAITDLRPAGTGLFEDERIDVVSESEWVQAGSPIRIVNSEGYRHVVRPVKSPGRDGDEPDDVFPEFR